MSARTPATRTEPSYAPPASPRTSRLAIWSVILSVLTLGGLGSVAGIIMGVSARRKIAETGQRGNGVAIAGIIIGVITLLFAIGYWIFLAIHAGDYGGGHGGSGGGGGGGY